MTTAMTTAATIRTTHSTIVRFRPLRAPRAVSSDGEELTSSTAGSGAATGVDALASTSSLTRGPPLPHPRRWTPGQPTRAPQAPLWIRSALVARQDPRRGLRAERRRRRGGGHGGR